MWRSGFVFLFFSCQEFIVNNTGASVSFLFPTSSSDCFQVCATCQHEEMRALFIQPVSKRIPQKRSLEDCFLVAGLSWWEKVAISSECELDLGGIFVRQNVLEREKTHLSRTRIELAMFLLFRELRTRTKTHFTKLLTIHIPFIRAFSFCLLFPDILRELIIIIMKGGGTQANISSLVLKAMMQWPQRSFRLRPVFTRWFYTCQTIQTWFTFVSACSTGSGVVRERKRG